MLGDVLANVFSDSFGGGLNRQQFGASKAIGRGSFAKERPFLPKEGGSRFVIIVSNGAEIEASTNINIENDEQVIVNPTGFLPFHHPNVIPISGFDDIGN